MPNNNRFPITLNYVNIATVPATCDDCTFRAKIPNTDEYTHHCKLLNRRIRSMPVCSKIGWERAIKKELQGA